LLKNFNKEEKISTIFLPSVYSQKLAVIRFSFSLALIFEYSISLKNVQKFAYNSTRHAVILRKASYYDHSLIILFVIAFSCVILGAIWNKREFMVL
jgi:hypothetical protein